MRKQILVLILLFAGFRAFAQQDLRVVNGITVDPAPIHAWFASPKNDREGSRPMKHWQELRLIDFKMPVREQRQ